MMGTRILGTTQRMPTAPPSMPKRNPRTTTKLPYAAIDGHLHPMVVFDERYIDAAYNADRISLILFPPLFIAFNIFYWIHYVA